MFLIFPLPTTTNRSWLGDPFNISEDTAAVFADDNFLFVFNISLTLGRYYVKAASAGTTFYHHDS